MTSENNYAALPSMYQDVARTIVERARQLLESGAPLLNVYIIGRVLPGGEWDCRPIVIDTDTPAALQASVHEARAAAAAMDAEFAAHVGEGWGLSPQDLPRGRDILRQYGKLANYPGRVDVASIMLETRDAGVFCASAPIVSDPAPSKRRTIVAPTFMAVHSQGGLLANILPRRGT